MGAPEIVVGLLVLVVVIALIARRLALPGPIALVIGGALVALVPGVPQIALEPSLVFVLILPPILMEAAYMTSWRDFRANLRAIAFLAIGMVIATAWAVAFVAHWLIPGMTLGTALVLGAIVSPPDAVAASAIARRLAVPSRIVTVLEGESLVNDATGLVIYSVAVAAVVAGHFPHIPAVPKFAWAAGFGIAVGYAIGRVYVWLYPRLRDPLVELVSTFLVAYAAYLAAEAVHASGVLGVVTAGLVIGWHAPGLMTPVGRLRTGAVWDTVIFVLNGIVFLLIGLQLPQVLYGLESHGWPRLVLYALATFGVVVAVRLVWIFPGAYLPRLVKSVRSRDPFPPWQHTLLVGWTGMRGVVSLAAALALPLTVADDSRFPHRDLIVFLSFCVIVGTLVVQGLTLARLIRWLGIRGDDSVAEEVGFAARLIAEAGLGRLSELAAAGAASPDIVDRLRIEYEMRLRLLAPTGPDAGETDDDRAATATRLLHRETVMAERAALLALRRDGRIGDAAMRRIERDLDLREARHGSAAALAKALAAPSSAP